MPVGKHCGSAEELVSRLREGFQYLAVTSDAAMLRFAAEDSYATLKPALNAGDTGGEE